VSGTFLCWAATDVGLVRSNNEDRFAVSAHDDPGSASHWQGELAADSCWALVADGMGGHAAGEIASALAIATLRAEMDQLAGAEAIAEAIERAHESIHSAMAQDGDLDGMGTTIVGAVMGGAEALLFNVGDSRAYHLSGGNLRQLSEDHVLGRNILTQCLGGMKRWPPPEPFVASEPLAPGDRLLLCTDGLTDMLFDPEIAELLAAPDPAEALVAAAIDAGGFDNVTVVVIAVG
jgi:protein phosphatase